MMLPSPFPNIHKDLFNEVIAASMKDAVANDKPLMDSIKDKLYKELDTTIGGYHFDHITYANCNDITQREKIVTSYKHLIFEHSIFSREQIKKMGYTEYCEMFEQILQIKDIISLVFALSFPLNYDAFNKIHKWNAIGEIHANIICYYWLDFKHFSKLEYYTNYSDYLKVEEHLQTYVKTLIL